MSDLPDTDFGLADLGPAAADSAVGEPRDEGNEGNEGDELGRRLREAGADALLALLEEHAPRLEPPQVQQALRNPFLETRGVELLAAQPRLLSFYEVRRGIALHPRTPEVLALRLVPVLFWRDLMELGADSRLRPVVRRAADLQLGARLPALAIGEKITLARRAGTGLLSHLRHDPSPRVMAALLDNPRTTEDLLAPVVHSDRTSAPILDLIAADRRWGVRYGLRQGICRNPRTRTETALRLLPALRKDALRAVAGDARLSERVRQRARLLLGEEL